MISFIRHLPVEFVHDGESNDDRYAMYDGHGNTVDEKFPDSFGVTEDSGHESAGLFINEEIKRLKLAAFPAALFQRRGDRLYLFVCEQHRF